MNHRAVIVILIVLVAAGVAFVLWPGGRSVSSGSVAAGVPSQPTEVAASSQPPEVVEPVSTEDARAAAAGTAAAKALMDLRKEHERQSMQLRSVGAEERTLGLLPLIERYSEVYQASAGEPLVQFEALRSLVGLYATVGDPASAAAANSSLLALEPELTAAGIQAKPTIQLFTINQLEVLAEAALVDPADTAKGQRLADYVRSTPSLYTVDDLTMLQGAAEKAHVALEARQLTADQAYLDRQMVQALLARGAAAAVGGQAASLDHWLAYAITAAARHRDAAAIAELTAIADAHPDRVERGASYYAVLPWAIDGWAAAYRSSDFIAAAKKRLESKPVDAFTPELTLHLAAAEMRSGDYPAAARRLTALDQAEALDPGIPAQTLLAQQLVFSLGEVFYRLDHRDQAQAYWDRFIRIAEPGDPRLQMLRSIRGTR